jgi:predicted PurR-regulated permease PerM
MTTGIIVGTAASVAVIVVLLPYLTSVIVALVLAAVLRPVVDWLCRHGIGRTAAAIIGALILPVLAILLTVLVGAALREQGTQWNQTAAAAAQQARDALGVDPVTPLLDAAQHRELILGVAGVAVQGVAAVFALAFGALIAIYVLLFLLKDGPVFAAGIVRRLPVPAPVGRRLLDGADLRLRRYIVGTTVVAGMDAVVISLGSAAFSLPLVAVIALVTFVAAFIPYLGAWLSAIFVIIIALGSGGLETALWMLVIVLVTQNLLEGLLRPYAFGKALNMHPLAVLASTAIGALLGGFTGVFIAPPLVAIIIYWRRTMHAAAATAELGDAADPPRQ